MENWVTEAVSAEVLLEGETYAAAEAYRPRWSGEGIRP